MIELLLSAKEQYRINVYVIYGQHDLRFHSSDTNNTPLMVLQKARAVTILAPDHPLIVGTLEAPVYLWGASWNEEPAVPESDGVHILVTHRMVISDKLWEQQEEFTFSKNMFRQFKHDFIITGDNHQHFTTAVSPKGKPQRHLINCGALMRSTVAQTKHEPCFYVCDTEAHTATQAMIPVASINSIMDITASEERKKVDEDLRLFIENLQSFDHAAELKDFTSELKDVDVPSDVRIEIDNILDIVDTHQKGA